jgi:hypothetical protein
MKALASATLLALFTACDQSGNGIPVVGGVSSMTYPPGWGPDSSSWDTTYSLSIANYDDAGYALWVQWQDDLGRNTQEFVVSLPQAPQGSFSHAVQGFHAIPGASYSLLLMDRLGNLVDAAPLPVVAAGELKPLSLTVMGGFLSSP